MWKCSSLCYIGKHNFVCELIGLSNSLPLHLPVRPWKSPSVSASSFIQVENYNCHKGREERRRRLNPQHSGLWISFPIVYRTQHSWMGVWREVSSQESLRKFLLIEMKEVRKIILWHCIKLSKLLLKRF